MTFELNTQFTFDADAKDVRDFLIGDTRKGWIEPEIDMGTFLVKAHCWLTPQPEANTLYGGSGSVSIHERHPLRKTFSPIAERSHFFKIAITQTEMGKCNVLWYVENDLNGWVGDARFTPEFLMKVAVVGLSRWWTDTVNRWKAQTAQGAPVKPTDAKPTKPDTGKRGKRSRYSQAERDDTVMAWERTDKDVESQTLADFLAKRFGDDEKTFKANVSESAFYKWRKDFYERNPGWTPSAPTRKHKRK